MLSKNKRMRAKGRPRNQAERYLSKIRIYETRRKFQMLRAFVNTLTEEEKRSEKYRDAVDAVNDQREKKRLENMRYRRSKSKETSRNPRMVRAQKFRREQKKEKEKEKDKEKEKNRVTRREENELREDLANYQFDIFSMYDFDRCTLKI